VRLKIAFLRLCGAFFGRGRARRASSSALCFFAMAKDAGGRATFDLRTRGNVVFVAADICGAEIVRRRFVAQLCVCADACARVVLAVNAGHGHVPRTGATRFHRAVQFEKRAINPRNTPCRSFLYVFLLQATGAGTRLQHSAPVPCRRRRRRRGVVVACGKLTFAFR